MKNQAILTLMIDKEEVLKLVPEKLSARGCDFICSDQQVDVFRDEDGALGCSVEFQIRLGLFPHCGPIPQYVKAEGEIIATLDIRKHQLVVLITHDDESLSINYQSSVNLKYKEHKYKGYKIHRQYANWISNLLRAIDAQNITI